MDFFNVHSVSEVKEKLRDKFKETELKTETVLLESAQNRVIAEDIISTVNVPEFNRSTVDGYAVKCEDTYGASEFSPSFLNLVGSVIMGEATVLELQSGEAIYVPTGGMIPQGADAVVMIEYVEVLGDTITANRAVAKNENIILAADDIATGDVLIKSGEKLASKHIAVLAALGKQHVCLYKKLTFKIISTGDEIVTINEELGAGKIRDINGYFLEGVVNDYSGEIVARRVVKDDFEAIKNEIEEGIDTADFIVLSGGSSVGEKDFTYDAINAYGEGVFVHGISIKPGKPTIMGKVDEKLLIGLPGHPVAAAIVFKVFMDFFMTEILHLNEIVKPSVKATLKTDVHSAAGKETYQLVTLAEENGELIAEPIFGKSGMIKLLLQASGYFVLHDDEQGIERGSIIEVVKW